MKNKGRIIVIEGCDGTGKKTQTRRLFNALRTAKYRVATFDFPDYEGGLVGQLIRDCLDGKHGNFMNLDPKIAATLYATDRLQKRTEIIKYYDMGYIIILDRYVSANQIHQAAKFGDPSQQKKITEWVHELEYGDFEMPIPDVVFFLDVPTLIAQEKIREDETRNEIVDVAEMNTIHQNRTRLVGQRMCAEHDTWKLIDCAPHGTMRTIPSISCEIIEHLQRLEFIQ